MPIEIRELIVKVIIEENTKKPLLNAMELKELKDKIVKDCTEKVMQKLENSLER